MKYFRGSTPAKQPVCGDGSALNLNNFGAGNIYHKYRNENLREIWYFDNRLWPPQHYGARLKVRVKVVFRPSLHSCPGQAQVWRWRCETNLWGRIYAKRLKIQRSSWTFTWWPTLSLWWSTPSGPGGRGGKGGKGQGGRGGGRGGRAGARWISKRSQTIWY